MLKCREPKFGDTMRGTTEAEVKEKGVEEEDNERLVKMMKPWEQHSAVICIPRFDYTASASLLHYSHSGFLVTCPIKREKSATKEAISILEKSVRSSFCSNGGNSESSEANGSSKRRKICRSDSEECSNNVDTKNAADNLAHSSEDSILSSAKSDIDAERGDVLSLVKMTRSGLLLFIFPRDDSYDVVDSVSNIVQSLEAGNLRAPLWCHRIFPIQATCCLNERDLHRVVSKLVLQFVNDKGKKLARPIKFAVGYNRRGIEETEMKDTKLNSSNADAFALLDRNKCFSVVAAAVKDTVSDSVVDLKFPQFSVLVELLPLSGIPHESLVVAVSVLPHNLVSTKPRLCVKALASNIQAVK